MASAPRDFPELRSQAEQKLAGKSPDGAESPSETQRLLHELQAHQIELEMQHEALVKTLAHAEAMRTKYQQLFDLAPVSTFTVAPTGHILEANQAAAKLMGQEPLQLVNRKLQDFFSADARPAVHAFLDKLHNSDEQVDARDLMLVGRTHLPHYVNAQGRACADSSHPPRLLHVVLVDVTALKLATDDIVGLIQSRDPAKNRSA